jgi:glycosyltransferase involved in cell wall biosynthesis
MGAAARSLAQERYGWPDIAARLEEIYERVTGREPARAAA